MIFRPTPLRGLFVVEMEPRNDERGFFARAWCDEEARQQGIEARFVQSNFALTRKAGTVRGLHYQKEPHGEAKLVRCIRGAAYDVVADVSPDSATFGRWFGVELSAESRLSLYVPAGFAHGYQALSDDTELLYVVTAPYAPSAEAGVRYDDPFFSIVWPLPVTELSEKDAAWPLIDGR